MAGAISVQLQGFDAAAVFARGLPPKIERAVFRKALRSLANKFARRIRAGTPRHSGLAKRSVKVTVRIRESGNAWASVKYKDKPSFYMRVYEFGSVRQRARPFFEQALGPWLSEVNREFTIALNRELEKAA